MTVTAADIRKKLQETAQCHGIDTWIDEVLTPSFLNTNGTPVTVGAAAIHRTWHKDNFMKAMSTRGFDITYRAAQTPAQDSYYEIGV